MVKKLFAQLGLMIMVVLLIMPVALADKLGEILKDPPSKLDKILAEPPSKLDAALGQNKTAVDMTPSALLDFAAKPYTDTKACINVTKKEKGEDVPGGPDEGYVITIMEEPLNTETVGDVTKGDDYVVRRCYRNTFQFIKIKLDKDSKKSYSTQTVPMLAETCSKAAQQLMTTHKDDKEYAVKYSCKEVQVILTKGGTSAIYGYISMLYRWGASMVGIIAVTVIIASGIQISASGGDSEAINSAKKRILQSITGIVVLFLSSLILYTINPTFFTK